MIYILAAAFAMGVGEAILILWLWLLHREALKSSTDAHVAVRERLNVIERKQKLEGDIRTLSASDREGMRKKTEALEKVVRLILGATETNANNVAQTLIHQAGAAVRVDEHEKRMDRFEAALGGEIVFSVGDPN